MMTFGAVLLQDRGDVAGECHMALDGGELSARDRAAVHGRLADGHLISCQDGVERQGKISARGGGSGSSKTILIVDPPAVPDVSLLIEHHHLARAPYAEQ